jgi:hypothetical protein
MLFQETVSANPSERPEQEPEKDALLQLILGTDKRNPCFSIYEDEERHQWHVYYGFELLQVVPQEREGLAFKLMVGQLYNANVKVGALQEVFAVDPKTMKRWGDVIIKGDPEELLRVMAGRQQGRKLTPEIRALIRLRWPQLQAQGERKYRQKIQEEVEAVFGVRLCGETLRSLFLELRREETSAPPPAPVANIALEPGVLEGEKRETDGASGPPPRVASGGAGVVTAPPPGTRQESPESSDLPQEATLWCDHAGLLLFSTLLTRVAGVVDPAQPLFQQWLACIWLGALNVEQTKFLNWEDLSLLLGQVARFPTPQRDRLTELARTPAGVEALLRFNAELIGAKQGTDFYLDPHTKHYTGMAAVLKGWCPGIRLADKAMHADFLHTAEGHPVYFECTDNFADLRQRVFELVARFRQLMNWTERVLTLVIDRGIFGLEPFEKFLQDPGLEVITWEKDYLPQPWPAEAATRQMMIERLRNHAGDVRRYRFEYREETWLRDGRLRRILVRATNPQGKTIEVSILSSDCTRPAAEIIRLMFRRWLQENDFKYLDKHFGINQITSYRMIDYADLAGEIQDRQVHSAKHQDLVAQKKQARRRQAALLLQQAQADFKHAKRQQHLEGLAQRKKTLRETAPASPARDEVDKQIAALEKAERHYQSHRQERDKKIQALNVQQAELDPQILAEAKEVSRLQELIARQAVRPDTRNKRLMDALKVIARNGFYQALQPFKKAYNNYRDDHDYFRRLTLSSGILQTQAGTVTVHLLPTVNYSPRLRSIIAACLEELNATQPVMPDGSNRRVRFRLAQRQDFTLTPTFMQC